MEMLVVFHKEIKPVNKEHQSILDLKLLFRNYNTRVVFVCFEVPCCFEVHRYSHANLPKCMSKLNHRAYIQKYFCTRLSLCKVETLSHPNGVYFVEVSL